MPSVSTLISIGVVLGALFIVFLFFRSMRRVAEPNEALIISGQRKSADSGLGFRIVTGAGTFVIPGWQTVRRLGLDLHTASPSIECVTQQGIVVDVKAVVIYKIGDSVDMIANAARRFLGQPEKMDEQVFRVFEGHLRSIIGGMIIEDMIRDRTALTTQVRDASSTEMEKLGLIVDSLQIMEIDDPTGYIKNLAAPHIAAVQKTARIAQAQNDQEATIAEQNANAIKASAERDSAIKRAGFQAETERAAATAAQAGPLAEAEARKAVVTAETEIAELEASREAKRLETTVRKPADAEQYRQVTLATAARDAAILQAEADAAQTEKVGEAEAKATKARGTAEADVIRAKGVAEGDAIKARSDALSENSDAVVQQMMAENMPAIMTAIAAPLGNIGNLTVLNGATGLTDTFTNVLAQAGVAIPAVLEVFKSKGTTQDGTAPTPALAVSSTDG